MNHTPIRTWRDHTPVRTFRVDTPTWQALHAAAASQGGVSTVLRAFIAWYLRRPGAKLPPRPPHPPEG